MVPGAILAGTGLIADTVTPDNTFEVMIDVGVVCTTCSAIGADVNRPVLASLSGGTITSSRVAVAV